MDTCPNCNRKLLSHASVRCNWCGAEINDESYQQQAAQERALFRAHEAERDAIEAARSLNSTYNSVVLGSPLGAVSSSLANTWAGRKRWEQARFQAQQKALQEYAATQQNGATAQPPPQNNQPLQGQTQAQMPAPAPGPQAANQTSDEEPANPENELRSMFRHLEL
jgi:hypothetical protein